MNNQTTATPFLTLGIPEKVVINGEQITHPTAVNAYLKAINENPTFIRAIAIAVFARAICIKTNYQKQYAPHIAGNRAAVILRYVGGLTLRKRTEAQNERYKNLLYMRQAFCWVRE